MKRLTLEATDENILSSIMNNVYNRNADVRDFVEALDKIEGNMFISLDARWGEGKTFYIRQIEKCLEYVTKRDWELESGTIDRLKTYFQHTALNSVKLTQSYLPIYYNAWLYDNHNDPLMSLVLTLVKKTEQYLNTNFNKMLIDRTKDLLLATSVGFTLKNITQMTFSGNGITDSLTTNSILSDVKTAEEIRELVKGILDDVITEKAQRLVIFIDELDRCRPTYAIEMLERIKHYFDDERIMFIVSVNKEQLIHTISKYYGYGFDSTGYLNKFFDLNVHMPGLREKASFYHHDSRQTLLTMISEGLNDYYRLSLRDCLIFKQRTSNMPLTLVNDLTTQGCVLSLFIPIIIVLDILDEKKKVEFLNGNSNIMECLAKEVPAIQKMIYRWGSGSTKEEQFNKGLELIKNVYDYTFKDMNNNINFELDLSSNLKRICIKLSNGFDM